MDQRSELESENRTEDIQRKLKFAFKAMEYTEGSILFFDKIDSRTAGNLAFEYAARKLEIWTFAQDMDWPDVGESSDVEDSMLPGLTLRREVQKALFEAQVNGDFKLVREYIFKEGERRKDEKNNIGLRLKKIAEVMPRSGDKVFLPPPAWMDPQFNPEASTLPSEKTETAG